MRLPIINNLFSGSAQDHADLEVSRRISVLILLRKFALRRAGATAVEYGLLVGLIALVIVGAVSSIGSNINATFNTIATTVSSAG